MLEHVKIRQLNDFFMELGNRSSKGIYFYRINGYNEQICDFIRKYYEAARTSGVIIEGRIPNPDEKNLSYYSEIMGMDFQMSPGFLGSSLKKWLPRMNGDQVNTLSVALYDTLDDLRKNGKNVNMLKNAYIKFMCWLYYRFERIISQLGDNRIPKILYEGDISSYELLLLRVLANAGCDVVLLQYEGDQNYRKLDPDSKFSDALEMPGMGKFPQDFNLKWIQNEIKKSLEMERLYGQKPSIMNCTNAWIEGKGLEDFRTNIQSRGSDPNLYYNCFCRINGVEDKLTYLNELYQFQLAIKNSKRRVVILEQKIPQPTTDEINQIRRKNYSRQEQMILDLSANLGYSYNAELQRVMVKNFIDIILEESKQEGMNLNKLTNRAVYLLCWIRRYQDQLFSKWKMPDIACFIYMGGCQNENEAMFLKFLARLPVDVLILNPNLDTKCCLRDQLLYEINYINSLVVHQFPQENSALQIGTAAYHAERELDTIMYRDSGIYRNQQYGKATAVTLQTMYEEISILWNQELKYRPNFSTVDDVVNMPVIFAKVSGIKDGMVQPYWRGIKELLNSNTILIHKVPFINSTDANPMKAYATEFFKNGKIQKNKIKSHPSYPYGFLREEAQEHILDKLQLLIDQKIIKGTFENGMEYTIVSTVLNMKKELVRMIQRFDFTKLNPKVVYINTTELSISLEDSILMAFLNLLGFDIVFFVPTGYQTVEKYYNKTLMEEHQVGEYVYDLMVPDFDKVPSAAKITWHDKIFRRGI